MTVNGIETLETRRIRWEIHSRASCAIHSYLLEKHALGIITMYIPHIEKNWAFTCNLEAPLRVFTEILCSTLARLYCDGQYVTEVTRHIPFVGDCKMYHWTIHAYPNPYYPDIILDERDVESVTNHLRKRRDSVWKPRR